ncbi:MAG TPA: glycosyltransferase family 4 protein [Candidatus Nitrosotalea sp.]|nr:glycosyltransferase family 4 protein [Candidatus Nitrosotalea sp.]
MSSAGPASQRRTDDPNVLFLATRDWYNPGTTGGDNTLWENARYLASVGYDVTFVAAGFPGAAKRETLDGIHVVRLGGIHSLWLTTFIRYMRSWRGRFDVVVAEGFGGSRIPRLSPLYVREPIITEWHQIHRELFAVQYPRLMNGPLNLLERMTAWVHRDTLVRAGTDEWRRSFRQIGFKPENVFVVPVSIRDDWLLLQPRARLDQPTIVWLGKLRRYKCPHHAVIAMEEVLRHVPSARLVIAGRRDDLKYEEELRKLAQRLGVGNSVDFRFDLSEVEKRELMSSARVLVVTSAVEGFGIVVLEANACGVPVVASSGVPEGAVEDDINGLRYPFGDIPTLAASIVRLLQDESLYARLSQNSLDRVKRFSWSRVGAQFEKVVAEVAQSAD